MNGDVADFAGYDLDPRMVMLCALLADQVHTLARLRRKGMWRDDPSELRSWLTRHAGSATISNFWKDEARWELDLWLCGTEALIDAIECETPIRIDRGRIVRLAKIRSEVNKGRGTRMPRLGSNRKLSLAG